MILCEAIKTNEPMPSVRNLAMELSLNPNTVQRAYQELERTGYIYTIKGKGSFVSESAIAAGHKRKELQEVMQANIDKAFLIGMSEEELRQIVEQCIANSITERETLSAK